MIMAYYGMCGGANLALQEMPEEHGQICQIGTSFYIIILREKYS